MVIFHSYVSLPEGRFLNAIVSKLAELVLFGAFRKNCWDLLGFHQSSAGHQLVVSAMVFQFFWAVNRLFCSKVWFWCVQGDANAKIIIMYDMMIMTTMVMIVVITTMVMIVAMIVVMIVVMVWWWWRWWWLRWQYIMIIIMIIMIAMMIINMIVIM